VSSAPPVELSNPDSCSPFPSKFQPLAVGESIALSGDKTKTKVAYLDFLRLWKDADSDIPIRGRYDGMFQAAVIEEFVVLIAPEHTDLSVSPARRCSI
jgi:hypothetical protein